MISQDTQAEAAAQKIPLYPPFPFSSRPAEIWLPPSLLPNIAFRMISLTRSDFSSKLIWLNLTLFETFSSSGSVTLLSPGFPYIFLPNAFSFPLRVALLTLKSWYPQGSILVPFIASHILPGCSHPLIASTTTFIPMTLPSW